MHGQGGILFSEIDLLQGLTYKRTLPVRVVIIGAGPVGLLSAIIARRLDFQVCVLESRKRAELTSRQQTLGIMQDTHEFIKHCFEDSAYDMKLPETDGWYYIQIGALQKLLLERAEELGARVVFEAKVNAQVF